MVKIVVSLDIPKMVDAPGNIIVKYICYHNVCNFIIKILFIFYRIMG